MNKTAILTFLLLYCCCSFGAERLCDKLDFIECPDVFSGNRSSGASVPGQGSTMSSAPASIANIDKTGIELIKFEGSYDINLVAGTGVVGSGFSTSNNEGTFFGNIPFETDSEYWTRQLRTDKYKSNKMGGIVAFNLFGKEKKKKSFSASVGLIGKYNSKVSKFDAGLGLTVRGGPIGLSVTRTDDSGRNGDGVSLDYYTDTISAGIKIANIAMDYTYFKNSSRFNTYSRVFSASVFLKKIMLTYGQRSERHGHPSILTKEPFLVDSNDTEAQNIFLGFQFLFKKRFIIGIYHNYYLNRELSLGVSAFF